MCGIVGYTGCEKAAPVQPAEVKADGVEGAADGQ